MDQWIETLKQLVEEMRANVKVLKRGRIGISRSVAGGPIEELTGRHVDDLTRWIEELEEIIHRHPQAGDV